MVSRKRQKSRRAAARRPEQAAGIAEPLRTALALRYQVLICAFLLVAGVCVLYPELVFQNKVMHAGDVEAATSFATPIQAAMRRDHGYPLWNPYLFSGMPSYESLSYTPYVYPLSVLTTALVRYLHFPNFTWLLFHVFLLGLGVCVLLMDRGAHFLIAAGAGILMMWMPNHVAVGAYGHGSQAISVAFIPFALLFWDRLWRGRGVLLNGSILAVVLGFQLLRAHFQISYYTFALLALHLLFFGILEMRDAAADRGSPARGRRFLRFLGGSDGSARKNAALDMLWASAIFAVIVGAALLISAVLFLPVREYAQYSIRGASETGGLDYGYATSWSLHPLEMLTFIIPFSYGFGDGTYYGHMPFTDYPNYVGLAVFLFAVGAVFLERSRYVRFLAFIAVISTAVAFGKFLPIVYQTMFRWLPYFNKFRVPVMVLIVQQLSFVLLAAIGVGAVAKSPPERLKKTALAGVGAGVILLFIAAVTGGYWTDHFAKSVAPGIRQVRSIGEQVAAGRFAGSHLQKDLIRLSIILLLTSGTVMIYFRRAIKPGVFISVIMILALADLYSIDRYILHPDTLHSRARPIVKPKTERDRFLDPGGVVEFLRTDESLYRVFPMSDMSTNRYMNFGISSIGGYHPAKLAIYDQFRRAMGTALQRGRFSVINMLNVKYVITSAPLRGNPIFKQVWQGNDHKGKPHIVYENLDVLPRAYFVDRYRIARGKAALDMLTSKDFDASREVILDSDPSVAPRSASGATARITHFGCNEIRVDARMPASAILVLSEIYYPKWKVIVDGAERETMQANYILRAVAMEAGTHEIVFRYDDSLLKSSLAVSIATLAAALIVMAVSIFLGMRGTGSGSTHRDSDV